MGFIIVESEGYSTISGLNTLSITTVLLETSMVEMYEPIVILNPGTAAAGLVPVTAECEGGKCKSIAFDKVPAFMFQFDLEDDVLSIGRVVCDLF